MENQQQPSPNMCRANCGFYGAPQFEDYCSKCFKDYIKRKQQTTDPAANRHPAPQTNTGNVDMQHQLEQTTEKQQQESVSSIVTDIEMTPVDDSSVQQVPQPVIATADGGGRTTMDTSAAGSVEQQQEGAIDVAAAASTTPPSTNGGTGINNNNTTPTTGSSPTSTELANISSSTPGTPTAGAAGGGQQGTPKKPPNRCHACNKKVGLTGISCRCGGIYCTEHRYTQAHDCTFDYKTAEREGLRKANPVVVSEKIERI